MRLVAAALVLLATAQAPAGAGFATASPMTAPAYCAMVPIATTCAPLMVRAPRAAFKLAVVTTEAARNRGLMFVPDVPVGQGMLFAFSGGDLDRPFWMKDTITPLDMVWVRADGTVTSVAANVPRTLPGTPDGLVARRTGEGTYVIELRAGDARRAGIARGTHLALPTLAAE
jgi:uncharacterized membrane protein (UPF0127 family)